MENLKSIKIVTYNIHGTRSPFLRRDAVRDLKRILDDYQADIICLQEFWKTKKTEREKIQLALEHVWPFFQFGENSFFPKYNLGNAIFSRYTISQHQNFLLQTDSREQRGLLKTQVAIPGWDQLDIYCTHLSPNYKDSLRELDECIKIIHRESKDSFIIGGDFNDWKVKHTEIMKKELLCEEAGVSAHGTHFGTFPALMPFLPLDRIYYRGLNLSSIKRCTERLGPSDHRSLLATFQLK